MPIRNVCNCPSPPGGSVSCEPHQLAICRVRNGKAERECFDPPDGMDNLSNLGPVQARRYHNWALQRITGQQRYPMNPISPSDEAILRQGVYHDVITGDEVWFRLPDELNLTSPTAAPSGAMPSSSPSGASATY
jgi:hypothetical protein